MMAKTAKGATKQAARTVRIPGFIISATFLGMRRYKLRKDYAESLLGIGHSEQHGVHYPRK